MKFKAENIYTINRNEANKTNMDFSRTVEFGTGNFNPSRTSKLRSKFDRNPAFS